MVIAYGDHTELNWFPGIFIFLLKLQLKSFFFFCYFNAFCSSNSFIQLHLLVHSFSMFTLWNANTGGMGCFVKINCVWHLYYLWISHTLKMFMSFIMFMGQVEIHSGGEQWQTSMESWAIGSMKTMFICLHCEVWILWCVAIYFLRPGVPFHFCVIKRRVEIFSSYGGIFIGLLSEGNMI